MSLFHKKNTPVPPEFANVSWLKAIAVLTAIICCGVLVYGSWVLYRTTNVLTNYELYMLSQNQPAARPLQFNTFEEIMAHDAQKRVFTPYTHKRDVFYNIPLTVIDNNTSTPDNTPTTTPDLPLTAPPDTSTSQL